MQSQAIRTGMILGGILLLIGLAVFFLDSKDAVAPTENSGVTVGETEEGTETAAAASSTNSTVTTTGGETVAPKPTASAPVTTTPKPTTPKPVSTYAALITYTDGGFEPSRVSIYEGQRVRFINRSERPMWVASNIHPIHAGYQERSRSDCYGSTFDQCESVEAGEYWDFTFNVVGKWEFHNHMRATDDGEITVLTRE